MNNWYKILELEYYPNPVENENVIKAKIREKKEFWSVQATKDYENGDKYRKYLDLERKNVIENEMMDASKRKKMINELQRKLFETVDEILDFFDDEKPISLKTVEGFSKQTGIERKLMEIRIREKGRKIKDDVFDQKIYEKYCENLKKEFKFKTLEENLSIVGRKDLYEFLNFEGIDARRLNPDEILQMIPERRRKLVKSNTETAAKKRIFGECEVIFSDLQKIKEYDECLEYLKYVKVSKELEKLKILSKSADAEVLKSKSLKYIEKINEILENRDEAKNIFIGFCEQEKISYTTQENYKNLYKKPKESEVEPKKTNYSQNNEDNNNQWNQNKQQKSSGTVAIWTIGGVLIFLLVVIIAVIVFKLRRDNNIPSVTQMPAITQPPQQIQMQTQPQSQQSQSKKQDNQVPEQSFNENTKENRITNESSEDNYENDTQADIEEDPEYRNVEQVVNEVYNGDYTNLENKDKETIQLMINYIYAKYGFSFGKKQNIHNYFKRKKWYRSKGDNISMEYFEENKFTPAEKYFIDIAGNYFR